jgi:xylose dehydrogenase (NAD/NADP)
MDTVRWGLLSTANINRALIPAIREAKRSELVAVASRTLESAENYARDWEIPQAFGSYEEMLESGEVDVVYIGLPNHLHAEWTIKALEAGLHVLCEKPFSASLQEVDNVIAARDKSGKVVTEAFMYRHHPQTRIVGEWVRSGKLGQITFIRGSFDYQMGEKGRNPASLNVRMVPEYGGGCLWDVGIYPLSFIQFLMGGPPEWVFGSQELGHTGIDEVFAGQMGFQTPEGDVLAQISSSFKIPYNTNLEIVGTEGRLYVSRPFNYIDQKNQVVLTDHKGNSRKLRVPKKSLYLGEVEDLQAAILDGKPPLIGLGETRNHVLTALALYESARTGQVVRLEKFAQQ